MKSHELRPNLRLKIALICQSFSILFIILLVKYCSLDHLRLVREFFLSWDLGKTFRHPSFGPLLICFMSLALVIYSGVCLPAFSGTQKRGLQGYGEMMCNIHEMKESGASFFMTFLLPLLIEDLSSIRGLLVYLIVISVVFLVLYKSNLYYQNPILTILGYRVFSFSVTNAYEPGGLKTGEEYIGITRKHMVTGEAAIRWKYISDNVYIVYNE